MISVAQRYNQRHWIKLIFFILYIGVLLCGAEAVVRVLLSRTLRYDVEMTRYALELKNLKTDESIGFIHRPNASANLMGVNIQTNSFGLRGKQLSLNTSTDSYRILLLGDSLTLGWGVAEEQTFASILQRELQMKKTVEIVNTGHGNFNTSQEVAYFFKFAQDWSPNEVVLFYFINDAEEMQLSSRWEFLGNSRLISLAWSSLRGVASRINKTSYVSYYQKLYEADKPGWEKTKQSLERLADYCRQQKIKFKVVILPELHQLKPYPFSSQHLLLKNYLDSIKVPYFDLTESFAEFDYPKELWVANDDAHPNEKAHARIAELTKLFLEEK